VSPRHAIHTAELNVRFDHFPAIGGLNGAIHPAFIVNSTDRKPRDGVGLSSRNEIYFVITKSWVSFYDFARFFRDSLGCSDALFLDGGEAPGLYAPELGRNDAPHHGGCGPIIAVTE
jgi:uncharacterized protein YigE (DUF2233 family)